MIMDEQPLTNKETAILMYREDPLPMIGETLVLTATHWLILKADLEINEVPNTTDKMILGEIQARVQNGADVISLLGLKGMEEIVDKRQPTGRIPEKRPSLISEKEKVVMEKTQFSLSSGYDDVPVASFKLVGPTLAMVVIDNGKPWLINHIVLGLTIVPTPDVTDGQVFMAFKKELDGIASVIHVTPQGYARITGEPLSDGAKEMDLTVVSESDFELNKDSSGVRTVVYPDGLTAEEVDVLAPEDDADWGSPVNRFFAFSWIEAVEPAPAVTANDQYEVDEEKEVEVEA
jgi:hypothetical protein